GTWVATLESIVASTRKGLNESNIARVYHVMISSRIRRAMSPSEVLVETRVAGDTVTVVRYAPFQELKTHAHGEEGLTVVLQGTFLEESSRGTLVAHAGSIATRPFGMLHTN